MIPSVAEIVTSLWGAWRLARLDPRGIACFQTTVEGVWRSFFAAALVAPAYGLMLAMRFGGAAEGTDPLRFALAEAIAYVVSWVAYPLVMVSVARSLDRLDRYCGYICAYNWSLVLQNLLVLPLSILTMAELLPAGLLQILWLAAIAVITAYVWFIARVGLDLAPLTAVGVVGIDLLLSFLVGAVADSLY
jgi:hypothetical protein